MSGNLFTPKISSVPTRHALEQKKDGAGSMLLAIAQYAVVALVGLLPIFFVPGVWATLGFDKVMGVIVLGMVVVGCASLLMLRTTSVKTVLPITLGIFWLFLAVAAVSGVLSGDVQDSLRGSTLGPQTVVFLGVMAIMMTVPLVLQGSKRMTLRTLIAFFASATVLLGYVVLRLIFGATVLPFGSFPAVTATPVGSFNDSAIFSGLVIILALVTLVQLQLRKGIQVFLFILIALGLGVLAVVNFFDIWIIIGFFGLLLFVYLLSKDTLFSPVPETERTTSPALIAATLLVCLVSVVFILAGDYVSGKIQTLTETNYVEVRPSLTATISVGQAVYRENILLGVGPNRFADAWRQHKDVSINETVFWDTNFNSGSGYVPTLFVTLGAVAGILLLLFHAYFLYLGYRMLLKGTTHDSFWYYIGVVSFAAAVYLWGMTYVYVPGPAILLLTAFFTSLSFVAYYSLVPSAVKMVPLAVNRQRGFFLMAAIIVVITTSVGVVFTAGKQYVAQAYFNKSQTTAQSVSDLDQVAVSAYALYPDTRFLRTLTQVRLARLSEIITTVTEADNAEEQVMAAAQEAVVPIRQAITQDPTDPRNYAILAAIFNALNMIGVPGTREQTETVLAQAESYDRLSPSYNLVRAQIAARDGEIEVSRQAVSAALALKQNSTEALYLSTQLDIAEGKVDSAIATTRSIVALDPQNATRYFQLGVLLSSADRAEEAIVALQTAVTIDTNYANARYILALVYLGQEQPDQALEQLYIVQKTNPDNQTLEEVIGKVERGETLEIPIEVPESTLREMSGVDDSDSTVTAQQNTESNLISPVNRFAAQLDAAALPAAAQSESVPAAGATSTDVVE